MAPAEVTQAGAVREITIVEPAGGFDLKFTRRDIFRQSSLAFTCVAGKHAFAQSKEEKEYVEVKTAYGRVRGVQNNGLATFKGIPYAGTVSGANRFKAAPPLKPWTGLRDVLTLGAPAIQPGQRRNEPPPAEDCLFLNIWAPAADGRKRPVMFYSHGGGFTT